MKLKLITLLLSSSMAFGQDGAQNKEIGELDPLVIESSPLSPSVSDSTQAASVLSGDGLEKAKGATISETLSNTPGVSQTGFGPAANRPIIRGMDKFRVRMLKNGTDTFDVSSQSEDHAVPVDPMMVDRVEVLRGAAALLYGGSAIGGVVNVIDRSIPTTPYGEPGASLLSSYSSVNEGWNYGATAFGSSGKLNFQVNGSKRDFEDYDAPSFKTEDHHTGVESGPFNKVENSYGDGSTIGFGGSYMLDSGYAGLSFSRYESTYGIPGEHAENLTRIEMESDRFEFRSEIEVVGSDWLNGVELNFGYGDYKHSEIGYENGVPPFETHATYLREGFEGKIAFDHEIGDLRGVFGLHGLFDELKIEGHESILSGLSKKWANNADYNSTLSADPANPDIEKEDSRRFALFLMEEYDLDESTTLNAGIRWENQVREYQGPRTSDRDDSTFSASGGFSRELSELWNISGNLSYSERSPDTAELYADGPHHATEAYEIGNPNLKTESATGVEIIVRKTVGKVTGQFSAFHTKFNNYVFLEEADPHQERDGEGTPENSGYGASGFPAGTEGLPVHEYESIKAEYQGIEVEIDWLAMESPGWDLLLTAYGDLLRGKNKTEGGNLSRIPATRLGLGFEVQQEKLDYGAMLVRSFEQDKLGHHEETTPAHSLLSAYASYDFSAGDSAGQVFLRGYNLTDELAYNHSSLLKQFAPLPGRSVEIGLKFDF